MMLVDLTEGELIVIRKSLREFRTTAPDHIKVDAGRLSRWREFAELYGADRDSADRKVTDVLASTV